MKSMITLCALLLSGACAAQNYAFRLNGKATKGEDYVTVLPAETYNKERGYGFDLGQPAPTSAKSVNPFYFSVKVPDGNYRVTLTLGNDKRSAVTTVRAESRRLFINNLETKKRQRLNCSFIVNKRDTRISETENVRIKPRETKKMNWDDKLTFEFNGSAPAVETIRIERVTDIPTLYLCGNSTVVDQDNEPWASWGQMIPYFLTSEVCVANYAESGERADSFVYAGRLKKILSQIKPGDYLFMEFGHNDQKVKGAGKGAFYSYMTCLKMYIDEARSRGAIPVLVTPTQRRRFDEKGKIQDTHEDYPEAMKFLAAREKVALIDLNAMTRTLYESMGVEESKHAFVHYPAGSYPGQTKELADNTHFNTYGAYEVAKCVLEGIRTQVPALAKYIDGNRFVGFDPAQPDLRSTFVWKETPFAEIEKPDGN